jgi:hypothetical protein
MRFMATDLGKMLARQALLWGGTLGAGLNARAAPRISLFGTKGGAAASSA